MNQQAFLQLQTYLSKWKRLKVMEYFGYALAGSLFVSVLLYVFDWTSFEVACAVCLVLAIGFTFVIYKNSFLAKGALSDLVGHLNREYPQLEESVDLLLVPKPQLSSLAQLQQELVAQRLLNLKEPIPFQHHLPRALITLLISVLISGVIFAIPRQATPKNLLETDAITGTTEHDSSLPLSRNVPTQLNLLSVRISPPAYTRIKSFVPDKLDLEIPWSSSVKWTVQFNKAVEEAHLIINGKDRIKLNPNKEFLSVAQAKIEKSGFYYIEYKGVGEDQKTSDYYKIKVIEDRAPIITVEGLEGFSSYRHDSLPTIQFNTTLEDDYGISNAYIISTLSRGKGESVKFREDTMQFSNKIITNFKQQVVPFQLALTDLKVAPGDELYFHIEAKDNRQPNPHLSKTHKYIIAIEDTASVIKSAFGTLAVNRIPEYFRSQRQIIIDTEKLIAQRGQLKPKAFQEQSNNIAIDQKLLRLRYGKFLGEEFESVIGQSDAIAEDDHDHDHDHEEGEDHDHAIKDHKHDHDHDHDHDHGGEGAKVTDPFSTVEAEDSLLEGYAHFHDRTEQATLYDESTSAKLRNALAEMWSAELHLRMGRPEEALPYEHKALKLIKAIQQASRIYVARVGFDPPVIKVAETRFTGELDKIQNVKRKKDTKLEDQYPKIKSAIILLEELAGANRQPEKEEKVKLNDAAEELAAVALDQPGPYLTALQQLKLIIEEELSKELVYTYYQNIRQAFSQLIPSATSTPTYQVQSGGRLSTQFLKELEN